MAPLPPSTGNSSSPDWGFLSRNSTHQTCSCTLAHFTLSCGNQGSGTGVRWCVNLGTTVAVNNKILCLWPRILSPSTRIHETGLACKEGNFQASHRFLQVLYPVQLRTWSFSWGNRNLKHVKLVCFWGRCDWRSLRHQGALEEKLQKRSRIGTLCKSRVKIEPSSGMLRKHGAS